MDLELDWIDCDGSKPEGIYDSATVAYQLRNGYVSATQAWRLRWHHINEGTDLVKYCVLNIKPAIPAPKWTVDTEPSSNHFYALKYRGIVAGFFPSSIMANQIADMLNEAGVEL